MGVWSNGRGWHCLVRMEWRPAGWSVCLPLLIFPCTIKSRSSLLAPVHPGGPPKTAVKRLWCSGGKYCIIIIIRSHHSITYVDVAYCYRPSIVVCRSVCLSVCLSVCQSICLSVTLVCPARMAEPIEMPFGLWTRLGPGNLVLEGAILRGKGASHCKV